jgi:NAD-dependent deacetylase
VDLFLCTQNIDDLHERAGSPFVHHMHGELLKALCGRCAATLAWRGDLSVRDACPACGHVGALRPDLVWFGKMPYGMDRIEEAVEAADLFVSIGTSGAVYPAAGLVRTTRAAACGPARSTLIPPTTRAPSTSAATARPRWRSRAS